MHEPAHGLPDDGSARPNAPAEIEVVRRFINSVDIEAGTEELTDLDALRRWLREYDLIGARERLREGDLERAIAVREALREVVAADHGGAPGAPAPPPRAALRTLESAAGDAPLTVSFTAQGGARLAPAAAGLDGAFAGLFGMIERACAEGTWQRIKICPWETCRWAFFDYSKNQSSTWCSMASCGNRAKARAYRQRNRAARR